MTDYTQVPLEVLTVISDVNQRPGPDVLHLQPSSIAIILEGPIVMDNIESHDQALCLVFGLIYALHLDYQRTLKTPLNSFRG